jgi:predicted amidophosphoribosyltransferase
MINLDELMYGQCNVVNNEWVEYYCYYTDKYDPFMEKMKFENDTELLERFGEKIIYDVDFDKFKEKVLKYTEEQINKLKTN